MIRPIADWNELRSMELKHLRTFVAVAEEEHFGRAAQRLHLAQPAVSKQVRDLEERLEVSLFDRLSRGVRLTAAGRRLLQDSRRLLADAEAMSERVRRVARGELGSLTIAYNETVSWSGVIPDSIRAYRDRYPEIGLSLLPMASVDQLAALRERRIDAGFAFHRPKQEKALHGAPMLVDRVVLAVPDNSRWAKRPPRRLAELAAEEFIWFPREVSPPYHDRIMETCQSRGLTPRVVQEALNASAILSLVAAGMGVTFAPASAQLRKPERVVLVPVPDMTVTVTMELVWRADDTTPALRHFIEIARACAKPTLAPEPAKRRHAAR
jgi:DNA-binding transcriptional LysR family regulator